MLGKMNALYNFPSRRVYPYNPKRYQEKKQIEINKHLDTCKDINCPVRFKQ